MFIRSGNQTFYDNFKTGAARHPDDNTKVLLTFADVDNDHVHLFELPIDKIEQYFNLVRQTAAGQRVEIVSANRMPRSVS